MESDDIRTTMKELLERQVQAWQGEAQTARDQMKEDRARGDRANASFHSGECAALLSAGMDLQMLIDRYSTLLAANIIHEGVR